MLNVVFIEQLMCGKISNLAGKQRGFFGLGDGKKINKQLYREKAASTRSLLLSYKIYNVIVSSISITHWLEMELIDTMTFDLSERF